MNSTTIPTPAVPVKKKGRGRTLGATSYLIVPLKALIAAGLGENAPVMISRKWAKESHLNLGDSAVSADAVTAYKTANVVDMSAASVISLGDEPASADSGSGVVIEDDAPAATESTATPDPKA